MSRPAVPTEKMRGRIIEEKDGFQTHHTEVQVLFDPLLAVLELLVQTHDVEGVQRVHDGGP